jgi:hypothetical protein
MPDYQSPTALISDAHICTAHGGLSFVFIRVSGQFIPGLKARGWSDHTWSRLNRIFDSV